MASVKLTKSVVGNTRPGAQDIVLRDTVVPGFQCKVTPAGRKVFMVAYRTVHGDRRKPALGLYGELTVEQARKLAQDTLAEVRKGGDPSAVKQAARAAKTVTDLCEKYMEEHARPRKKPSSVASDQRLIDKRIIPNVGKLKIEAVARVHVQNLMDKLKKTPTEANRTYALLSKMMNLAEAWGYRKDGTNPCRHVEKFAEKGHTRLLSDGEVARVYKALEEIDAERSEQPVVTLAVRLQFALAARMGEVLTLQWDWIDEARKLIAWPDAKAGRMVKPLTTEVAALLATAPKVKGSPFVCPSISEPLKEPLSRDTYAQAWRRILQRAKVPHVGTHGIRHRAATDIANSGTPLKVGMAMTGHKTVAMFMRYVHTEDDPVRAAAEKVAERRKALIDGKAADVVRLKTAT